MDRKTTVFAIAVFILATGAGVMLASNTPGGDSTDNGFSTKLNVTADNGNPIATARFNNQSLDIMYEDTEKAKFYLDMDRDGSFDYRIENLTHDGSMHQKTKTVEINGTAYELYFRYQDSAEKKGDGWMWLYRVRELQ